MLDLISKDEPDRALDVIERLSYHDLLGAASTFEAPDSMLYNLMDGATGMFIDAGIGVGTAGMGAVMSHYDVPDLWANIGPGFAGGVGSALCGKWGKSVANC